MVVPTYLGTMALGGHSLQGVSLGQYNSLLMSNMGAMGLQMTGLQDHTHSGFSGTPSYPGFTSSRLQLPPQVLQQPLTQKPGDSQPGQGEGGQPGGQAKSFSPEPSDHNSTPPPTVALEEANVAYLAELEVEKERLDCGPEDGPAGHVLRLLENEIAHVQGGGSKTCGQREHIKYFDIYRERPVRLTVRALIPVREHPKFNFVGKLLGPKGNSMKRLQEETMTKMAVLGRGSMRDKQKEEELRSSADPKYQHLAEDLHVEITAFAPPAEAHARIAYALTEVRKYLIPDSNDEIRQEQMREMELITTNGDVIDTLKQQGGQAAQLILQAFPGQNPGGPVLHPGASLASPTSFLTSNTTSHPSPTNFLTSNNTSHPSPTNFLTSNNTSHTSPTTFLTSPFLPSGLPVQELGDRLENEMPPSCPPTKEGATWPPTLKAPSPYHSSAHRAAAACPYSKPT